MSDRFDDFVNVSVRVRPLTEKKSTSTCLQIINANPAVLHFVEKQQLFHFDNIFNEDSDQENVYDETVRSLVLRVKEGYNCTVFAYGQTGTGKTYTVGTSPKVKQPEDKGLIIRALEDFFDLSEHYSEIDIHVSFMEIYNERAYDLLKTDTKVPIAVKGLRVEGLSIQRVSNVCEAKSFLQMGGKNRHTGETKQNSSSSRSHAIFTIYCNIKHSDKETSAKLHLVDLAGSESVKKTGTQGSTFQEGININKGLLCIGQVMTALGSNSSYIPYRQSVITTILQDSLNKRNFISLIACVNINQEDANETLQTLEFAYRVKKMKNKPEVNEVVTNYKMENPSFFEKFSSRVGTTPFKRSAVLLSQTPITFKKPKTFSTFNNVSVPSNTTLDSSKSLSITSSSSITNGDFQMNFSPVIRKYMNEMESTIVEKLQTVIRNTLRRSNRRKSYDISDKENTPKYSWKQIQNEVSNVVKSELIQFTAKTARATSSPIEALSPNVTNEACFQARRVLDYESPEYKFQEPCDSFKKPKTPIPILIPSNTPHFKYQQTVLRRSTRLSVVNRFETSIISAIPKNSTKGYAERRRTARKISMNESCELCKCHDTKRFVKTKATSNKKANSIKTRTTQVLAILNKGNTRELQKLATIGSKTAERIILFRGAIDNFKKISDLSNMPGWSKTKFENFVEQNYLKT